ncbi:membrane protein [Microbacterium phage AluminumJesus]|nr:membrane protein [Microbacterium phage Blab]UJD20744.1 membrane protein [Microbacterium phage AluminumJesus]
MTTLIIPEIAAALLLLAALCGVIVLLALGGELISREVSHWSSDRAVQLRRRLSFLRTLTLIAGGVLICVAVMITIAEAGL